MMRQTTNMFEQAVKAVYGAWKKERHPPGGRCPDEERLACFMDDLLDEQEMQAVRRHVIYCEECCGKITFLLRSCA